ncbi:glycosyltransferase family 39 protein [Halopenitus sp. POP-27]|uniref:glycosyltransferase family 39 protein n=1 Tax=Halopenitus sp. POP-27 TaxID=2994425 RepID=UPI0024688D18|nr:glycosyltransferase family 39 protein [Halopenitus sp. POP-27]
MTSSRRVPLSLRAPASLLRRAVARVRSDLREDPYLPYLLVLAVVLCGFWIHHRVPNFATRDEKSRILDVLVAYGRVIDDPSLASLREGVAWSRVPFGATVHLYAVVLAPVVLAAWVLGDLGALADLGVPSDAFGFYAAWQALPEWLWTASILLVRLTNVAFAVGAVYLTYRIGAAAHGRPAGRLAALLLTLTFGFLTIAHEGGEDMPALWFVLLAVYLSLRYVQTDDRALVVLAGAAGGIAIAFKLTAAPVVLVVGAAYVLRARHVAASGGDWRGALWRPRLFAGGALAGVVCIVLGFPTALVGEVGLVIDRIFAGSTARASHTTGPTAPIWWWFLRGYLSGLSLPLLLAGLVGTLASIASLRTRREGVDATMVVLTALFGYLVLFAGWHDFRVHHLLPTFPLIALLVADRLLALREARPPIARPLVAVLLLATGLYAGVGVAGYADMPRDNAEDWLTQEAGPDDTVETYRVDFQDTAVPYGMRVNHVGLSEDEAVHCPTYIQLGYRDLLFLKEGTYYRNGGYTGAYVEDLLGGETNYEIAAEFGPRPPGFVPERATPGSATDLLRYGVVPQTDQYADEQELRANQYTLILERTGECESTRNPPL